MRYATSSIESVFSTLIKKIVNLRGFLFKLYWTRRVLFHLPNSNSLPRYLDLELLYVLVLGLDITLRISPF